MKIMMLSWEYPPRIVGGISRVVYDLAQKVAEKGNEVHVITCWVDGVPEMEKDNNVYVHRVRTYSVQSFDFIQWVMHLNFALVEHAARVINQLGKFDIVHAHDWIVAYAAKVIKNTYITPLCATIHATESGRNWGIHNDVQRYISSVEWWLCYESWKVIVNSGYMKNEVKNLFQLSEDKIRVIFNGVDLNKFDGYEYDIDFRRRYACDSEKIVFFVGRLVQEKGVHVLIEAVPKIIEHYNDVKFIIAGKGPQFDYLKCKVYEMGVAHKVCFTGFVSEEELKKLYKVADIAVFPSLYEPFGIVALEGMVAKVPVVVSDTGGLGEIVFHGIDGMKSYTGNPNSLADSILELLFDPEKVEKIKRNAMEKVKRLYNWDKLAEDTLGVYSMIHEEYHKSNWIEIDVKSRLGL